MDKFTIGFFADVLYHKGILNATELDAIYDLTHPIDVQGFLDRLEEGEFNVFRKGEHYEQFNKGTSSLRS